MPLFVPPPLAHALICRSRSQNMPHWSNCRIFETLQDGRRCQKNISKNPITMCAIARFLAILATLAEVSAMLALLALVLSLRTFCTNKELVT